MSYVKIRPRRGTAEQWTTANPVLAEGEIGFEVPAEGVGTGVSRVKLGDGVTAWSDLPYSDPLDYIEGLLESKADSSHNHDGRYYTESEITNLLSGKSDTSHTHDGRYYTESEVDTKLGTKQATITGGASTIASSNLTANRALVSNGSGKVAVSAVTSTELGYLDGVTSNIQTQLKARWKIEAVAWATSLTISDMVWTHALVFSSNAMYLIWNNSGEMVVNPVLPSERVSFVRNSATSFTVNSTTNSSITVIYA